MDKLNVDFVVRSQLEHYIGRVSKESTIHPGQRWDAPTHHDNQSLLPVSQFR